MGRRLVCLALAAGAVWSGAGPAWATPPMGKKAKDLGYPSSDCSYCHSFDMAHMRERAKAMGVSNMNCYVCHGDKLPRMGKALFNDRGWWLVQQKDKRSVKTVEMEWLKDYVEPPAKKPERAPEKK